MNMEYIEDWEKSKKRFEALWNREVIDRCCISVRSIRNGSAYPIAYIPNDYNELIEYWTDPDKVVKRSVDQFESIYFGGDAFPCVPNNFGPEAHSGYFTNNYRYEKTTIWYNKIINDLKKEKLSFNPNNPFYRKHIEFAKTISDKVKGKYYFSIAENASATDALANLRGTSELLLDYYDNEDSIKEFIEVILNEWIFTQKEFFDVSQKCNDGGSCVGWLGTWAPGYHCHIQCDLSVMLSPDIFDRFILNELNTMANSLDYCIYHLDGIDQVRHLDSILSIDKIDMIQWMNCVGQEKTSHYIPILKKIQQAGKCLHLFCSPDEVKPLLENLSSKGLFLVTQTDTEDQAKDLVKLVEELSRE